MIKKRYAYIEIVQVQSFTKTKRFIVKNNKSGSSIGWIQWYGPWRQYCFFPIAETVYSAGCLQDIHDFISAAMSDHAADVTKEALSRGNNLHCF